MSSIGIMHGRWGSLSEGNMLIKAGKVVRSPPVSMFVQGKDSKHQIKELIVPRLHSLIQEQDVRPIWS
uniref:Uncharacterized protein n=1 Tax=Arundo donax TaxID=35708 RepID=A0A0A9CBX0_ARUDO